MCCPKRNKVGNYDTTRKTSTKVEKWKLVISRFDDCISANGLSSFHPDFDNESNKFLYELIHKGQLKAIMQMESGPCFFCQTS